MDTALFYLIFIWNRCFAWLIVGLILYFCVVRPFMEERLKVHKLSHLSKGTMLLCGGPFMILLWFAGLRKYFKMPPKKPAGKKK